MVICERMCFELKPEGGKLRKKPGRIANTGYRVQAFATQVGSRTPNLRIRQ